MLARKMSWLVALIVLLTFVSSGYSEAPKKKNLPSKSKEWRVIDGFRSAKFGMSEKQVLQAIAKDFKISKKQVERLIVPVTKTKALIIHTAKLMEVGGPADIVYLLGYKSKKLMTVNIDWGKGVTDNVDPKELVFTSNVLVKNFLKKRYEREGYVVNLKRDDTEIIAFKGQDQKGRGITLILKTPKAKGEDNKEASKNMSLVLSYYADVKRPDIFKANNKP
jgi:hypothetical protein